MSLRFFLICMFTSIAMITNAEVEMVYQCNFKPDQISEWKLPPTASIIDDGKQSALQVSVLTLKPNAQFFAKHIIDLTPYRKKILFFSCRAKAENVTKPKARYNGVKFMLHFKSPSGEKWYNPYDLYGTFDWTKIEFSAPIPDDATTGEILLGLQDSTGKAAFSDIKVTACMEAELFPPIPVTSDFQAEYTDRVKNMPMLRGVMSPPVYRKDDLDELAKWGANLIRWQLVSQWGKPNQDRNLTEYNQWINSKIAELDKVMADAKRLGIKVIIDMHSPPGGRYPNRNLAMCYEMQYTNEFVKVWERIATHFKGHPALWGFDLINEPVQNMPAETDYLTLQFMAAKAIRTIDPEVPIIIASNLWNAPETYSYLSPLPLKNIIYQVHMYIPGSYTHQNVFNTWGVDSTPTAPLTYPGIIESSKYDRETLRKRLKPVIDFQKKYGTRMYVGEFSAIRWAPGAANYLDDCISLFEEYQWDWSYHSYREWHGWSVEHSNDPLNRKPVTQDTDRKKVLLKYFTRNR